MLLFFSGSVCAQQFQVKHQLALPDSVQSHELAWTDLDNDGLLDILVIANTSAGKQFLLCYKSDSIQPPVFKSGYSTGLQNSSYLIADYDLDNDMDIVVSGQHSSGPLTVAMLNDNNFVFTSDAGLPRAASIIRMGDLDEDGRKELVLSGNEGADPFFTIYKRKNNQWSIAHDSLDIKATAVEIFDFDIDGRNDLFVSGRKADNSIVTTMFYNKANLFFKPEQFGIQIDGHTNVGDVNHDGYFDIMLTGKNSLGRSNARRLTNHRSSFTIDSLQNIPQIDRAFIADFNSDGLADIHVKGSGSYANVNKIVRNNQTHADLPGINVKAIAFGDYDRDGDLDLLQAQFSNSASELFVYENADTAVNKGPMNPHYSFAVRIYNRTFMYWNKPIDDHTSENALTYDVTLRAENEDITLGEYDEIKTQRLTVTNGNNGPNNYLLLKNIPGPVFAYGIQSIDNAFFTKQAGGPCTGGGAVASCETAVAIEKIPVCKNEVVSLPGEPNTLWFSFANGFMDISSSMQVEAEGTDTVFSVTPGVLNGCAALKIYHLNVTDTMVKKTFNTKYVCEGKPIPFSAEDEFQATWSSSLKGFLSNNSSITFTPTQNDTVKVTLTNGTACVLQRNTALRISKPVVTLNGETFTILRGNEVQLMADGGVKYKWVPPAGLSNDTIPSPLAFPGNTTEYTVTVADSIGCEASAKVLVIVEGTAFVPNLFTPNEDGKNDELKVYGLDNADNFSFTIHNREGSLVYETHDAVEASNIGWNGTVRGNKQPNGVYFWKVKGKLAGKPLLLNGKTSGSIVLLR